MSKHTQLFALSCFAACLHNLYLYWISDSLIVGPAEFVFFPVAIIAFTFGLSLPGSAGAWPRKPWMLFLLLATIPVFVLSFLIIDPVCLHRPGRRSAPGSCVVAPDEIRAIQLQIFYFMMLAPFVVAAAFSWLGIAIRYYDSTPEQHSMPSVMRVFCWLAGAVIMLFGLQGMFDQTLSIATKNGRIAHHQGLSAVVVGTMLFVLGYVIFDAGCHLYLTKRLRKGLAVLARGFGMIERK